MILTPEQRTEFDRAGVLRLEGLLSAEGVRRAREAVLRPLARLGLWRDGAWRLDAAPRPTWPAAGLKTGQAIGNKHPELAALTAEPAVAAVVDTLLDGRPFDRTIQKRPQVLFTLPNADQWFVPNGWHADYPRLASGQGGGVQLFAFLDVVAPGGGGTVVVAGSHRLLNQGRDLRMQDLKRLLCREPYFRRLYADTQDDRSALMNAVGEVEGVALKLVELTGAPGDAYFVDLRVLHAGAPNAAARPRMMLTDRFVPADMVGELARAFGWE